MPRKKKTLQHKEKPVILIAALQHNRGIGYQGDLLYHIKDDLKFFSEQTQGHSVIMGRKTWESLPANYRPLPNRQNIIVTRNSEYTAPGAIIAHTFHQALEAAAGDKIFVIGGSHIYTHALSYADTLLLTVIEGNKKADTFFPEYQRYFMLEARSEQHHDPRSGAPFIFETWIKK